MSFDADALIAAVTVAIGSGAVAAPTTLHPLGSDAAYLRTQLEVGIEQDALNTYLGALRKIPEMARLDNAFVAGSTGGFSTTLESIGCIILARSIATGNVEKTCRDFGEFLRTNKLRVTAVLGVSGVHVAGTIKLGPDVVIRQMTSLPAFYQRGVALAQPGAMPPSRWSIPTAITMDLDFGPVIYFPPDQPAAWTSTENARNKIEEAMFLLSVLGAYPAERMFWIQPHDLLFSFAFGSSFQIGAESLLQQDSILNGTDASQLGDDYFALNEARRTKQLRIPLDRLNRAGRERDPTDRAIDLGIALEALLLHDDKKGQGELSFRLALRGAWLVGSTTESREEVFNLLRSLYNLRSTAVHSGELLARPNTRKDLQDGLSLCQTLIKAMIAAKCDVNWNALVLG